MGIPFLPSFLDKMIITDASLLGWGAHMDSHMTQGMWTPQESRMHINILEFRAVRRACESFLPFICSHHILLMSDSTTAVFYNNREGGTKCAAVCAEVVNLWNWFIYHPGIPNRIVDSLSRHFAIDHEWELYDSWYTTSWHNGDPD